MFFRQTIVVSCVLGLAGLAAAQSSAPERVAVSAADVDGDRAFRDAIAFHQKWQSAASLASKQKLVTAARVFVKMADIKGEVSESQVWSMAASEAKSAFNPAPPDLDTATYLVLAQAAVDTDPGLRESPSKTPGGQARVNKVDALTIKSKLHTTISNVLKTRHDTAKNSINNIR